MMFVRIVKNLVLSALAATMLGGCGGYYILSVPDQVASSEGQAVPVARLQRNDFFIIALPNPGEPLQFKVYNTKKQAELSAIDLEIERQAKYQGRAAWTDDGGYAGVVLPMANLPVASRPGCYYMKVTHQDSRMGEEIFRVAPLYVWDPKRPVVVVEQSVLPEFGHLDAKDAADALKKIAETHNILYLTKQQGTGRDRQHFDLTASGYPEGPVLLWEKRRWKIVMNERFGVPVVKFDQHMISPLVDLKEQFPKLRWGIGGDKLAAEHFTGAGLECIGIGNVAEATRNATWADLSKTSLPTK